MMHKSQDIGRIPEIISDLAYHAAQVLIESMNVDSASAKNVGHAIADRMMRNWGGQSIYFPKGISGRASDRDYQIYSECNGRNYAELAKKYNLTLQWIYKIVKRVHTEKQQKQRML
ncbi:DNA-binding protein [Superficieibacter electus]|uniref:DNA-binding protein n=1 Tax=Superficieibacter electus TaxID=2022662 RepID=A0A2P5GLU2_9ENTR|nr:Mor transcription activator family protein [Superficieibacter electus]POP43015.1 DNA-binding protein [Superficieibacter electus]POP46510.1 DNA-binding protein [Superficieibacter electus]